MRDNNIDVEYQNKGSITCNKNILLSIINLATKEISGVSCLSHDNYSWFKRLFKRNSFGGVKIKFNQSGAILVDVYISVYFGYSVPDVAFRVQENIKNGIAAMIDMKTAKVNVHVIGVDFTKEDSYNLA
ncbi:MAG: Asp23/Gls24 family envelope stress response protein [Christensenellales bacterium]